MAKQAITYEQIMSSLKKKDYKPVYLLMGDEDYFIDSISDYIRNNVLSEEEQEFNLTVLYGKETDCNQIIMAAKRYPLMAEYQVIIVREAQNIKDLSNLSLYLTNPLKSTILVLCHKHSTVDMRKKFVGDIDKNGIVFVSKRLYDNQVSNWVTKYAESVGLKCEYKAANMISEFLGADLSKITNEIGKLAITLKNNKTDTITADIVEQNIGISKEYNNFELINAIINRNILKSNRIIEYFASDPKNNPLVVTTSMLFNFFANLMLYHWLPDKSIPNVASELKINPYFVNDYITAARNFNSAKTLNIISLLRAMDAQSKGYGIGPSVSERDILRETIYKILH